jgi:hypothetical protein
MRMHALVALLLTATSISAQDNAVNSAADAFG